MHRKTGYHHFGSFSFLYSVFIGCFISELFFSLAVLLLYRCNFVRQRVCQHELCCVPLFSSTRCDVVYMNQRVQGLQIFGLGRVKLLIQVNWMFCINISEIWTVSLGVFFFFLSSCRLLVLCRVRFSRGAETKRKTSRGGGVC